jgi:hypothetical protein
VRGRRVPPEQVRYEQGSIPARAGPTGGCRAPPGVPWEHPRAGVFPAGVEGAAQHVVGPAQAGVFHVRLRLTPHQALIKLLVGQCRHVTVVADLSSSPQDQNHP